MTFEPTASPQFLEIFAHSKDKIRAFPGCQHLELWRCTAPNEHTFMTHSHWDSEAALETYRHSALFKSTWAKTKVLFAERPQAWSLEMEL